MQELTDDQLDDLFRKSAEEFVPSFETADWRAMQHLLDNADRPNLLGRNRLVSWGLPLLFLILLTGVHWNNLLKSNVIVPQPTVLAVTNKHPVTYQPQPVTTQESRQGDRKIMVPNTAPANPDDTRTEPVVTLMQPHPRLLRAGQSRPAQKPTLAQAYSGGLILKSELPSQALTKSIALTQTQPSSPRSDSTPETIITAVAADGIQMNDIPAVLLDTNEPNTDELSLLDIQPGQWPSSFQFTNRPVALQEPAITPRQRPTAVPMSEHGLSIRFAVAPDLSAVGLHNFARPGTNIGAMVEYRLAPRWSVQAGVLRSAKVYTAQLSNYAWTGKPWAVMPEGVEGRCLMLDIPINLRYDFVLHPHSGRPQPDRWFVSGGVTTYVILHEAYTYNYASPDNPAIKFRNWQVDGTSRYGFSQLNLSAGYERTFSRRLSWQVEPFMKIPLKGVGFYKINLLSTGAFLSLRYKL